MKTSDFYFDLPKELIAQGFECRAVLGTHGKLLFMFERNDEVRKAYREAKDKIFIEGENFNE